MPRHFSNVHLDLREQIDESGVGGIAIAKGTFAYAFQIPNDSGMSTNFSLEAPIYALLDPYRASGRRLLQGMADAIRRFLPGCRRVDFLRAIWPATPLRTRNPIKVRREGLVDTMMYRGTTDVHLYFVAYTRAGRTLVLAVGELGGTTKCKAEGIFSDGTSSFYQTRLSAAAAHLAFAADPIACALQLGLFGVHSAESSPKVLAFHALALASDRTGTRLHLCLEAPVVTRGVLESDRAKPVFSANIHVAHDGAPSPAFSFASVLDRIPILDNPPSAEHQIRLFHEAAAAAESEHATEFFAATLRRKPNAAESTTAGALDRIAALVAALPLCRPAMETAVERLPSGPVLPAALQSALTLTYALRRVGRAVEPSVVLNEHFQASSPPPSTAKARWHTASHIVPEDLDEAGEAVQPEEEMA